MPRPFVLLPRSPFGSSFFPTRSLRSWVLLLAGFVLCLTILYSIKVSLYSRIHTLSQEARQLHEENMNLEVRSSTLASIQTLQHQLPRMQGLVEANEKWQFEQTPADAQQPILQGNASLQRGTLYHFASPW